MQLKDLRYARCHEMQKAGRKYKSKGVKEEKYQS